MVQQVTPAEVRIELTGFVQEALGLLAAQRRSPTWKADPNSFAHEDLHRKADDPGVLLPDPPQENWREDDGGVLWEEWQQFQGLPSYESATQAIVGDERFYRRVYLTFGAAFVRYGWQHYIVDHFMQNEILNEYVERSRDFTFDKNVMLKVLHRLEKILRSPFIEVSSFIPLWGVRATGAIELLDGVVVRPLEDSELSAGIAVGTFPVHRPERRGLYLSPAHQTAVCLSRRSPMAAESLNSEDFDARVAQALLEPDMVELGEQAARLLNLIGDGAVQTGTPIRQIITRAGRLAFGVGSVERREIPSGSRSSKTLDLSAIDPVSARSLWPLLHEPIVKRKLGVALNRFSSSQSRANPSEGILDLAIAAEALFTSGGTGELTFRMSLNAALFLSEDTSSRSELRQFFREVYKIRSEIVHGSAKLSDRSPEDLAEVRNRLSMLMRNGLQDAVRQVANSGRPIDWDHLLDLYLDGLG